MTSTFGLAAALIAMMAVVVFNLWIFRLARTNPKSVLIKGDLAASFTALLVTTLLVISWAVMISALFAATQNITASMIGTIVLSVAMMIAGWKLIGIPPAHDAVVAPVAPSIVPAAAA